MNDRLDKLLDANCAPTNKQLNLTEIEDLRQMTPSWQYCANENVLCKTFRFDDYHTTIDFVNTVAKIAEQQDHHPEMLVSFNRCKVSYSTHTVNGVTINDFICAANIDKAFTL